MEKINSASEFQDQVQQNQMTVAKFFTSWCPDCKRLDQYFDQIVSEYPNLNFIAVDAEELADVAEQQNVRGIPSLLVYNKGKKIAHLHSANLKTPQQARDFLNSI